MGFGEVIKQFRIENHLTQEALAKKSGVSRSYLSKIENGETKPEKIAAHHFKNLAEGLGLTVSELFEKANNNPAGGEKATDYNAIMLNAIRTNLELPSAYRRELYLLAIRYIELADRTEICTEGQTDTLTKNN